MTAPSVTNGVRQMAAAWLMAAVGAFGIVASGVAQAQAPAYYTSNCSSCHGNPTKISDSVAGDSRARNIIGVGGAWLSDGASGDALFKAHLNLLRANATQMGTLADEVASTNRDAVRNYFLDLRDGRISTGSLAFGSQNIGTSSAAQSVLLTNDRFLAATFSVAKNGARPGDFTITGCSVNGAGTGGSVPAASSCTLSVIFNPGQNAATSRTAGLDVTYSGNEGGDPAARSVSVGGSVPAAAFSFTAGTTTTSARVDLAQSSDSNVGTITNSGQATLSITSIALLPPAPAGATYAQIFSPFGACSSAPTLAAGQSCSVWLRFTPALPGATTATFRISPSGFPVRDVSLQGTGTRPLISPTAQSLPFGNVQIGVPKALPLVVTNGGDAPMTFSIAPSSGAARTGANPGDFGVGGTCVLGTPVAAGATCTLSITFTPGALGARSATLTISSDATNGPLVVALDGTGVALPEPIVTYPAADFPDTVVGETATQTRTVTIHNDRTRSISYAVSDLTDFKVGTESCAGRIVAGGADCTVAIRFQPTLGAGEGRRQGTLTFTFAGTGGDVAPSNSTGVVAGVALLALAQSSTTVNAAAVVGSPTTSSVLLTNRSSSALTLSSFVFGGTTPTDYSLDASSGCTAGQALSASSSCTLVIRFAPAAAGTRNATLAINHTAPGSPQSVTLLGTATPAPQGRIELGAPAITFADTQLGASSARSVVVRNSGNLALTFSAFTIAGTMPGDFARSGDCSIAVPLTIGAQCTLTVTFAPAALGLRNANLSIASDASNGTAVLALSGVGVPVPAPQVSLAPAVLDFGVQTIGGIFPARRIRLANIGTADLALATVALQGAGFTDVSAAVCPATLVPGAGCDIDIAFTPTAAQAYAGALRVTSNAAGSPHVAVLQGTGTAAVVPTLVWSPATTRLDFGTVSAGSLSAVQSVTLLNQGPGGVNLTVLNAIGADASSFSVVGGTCVVGTPLFAGQTCQVDLRFAPGSSGNKTATLQVASTGSFPPALTLAGLGLAGPNPSLALSVSALAFDKTRIGAQSLPATVRLMSSGSGVVTVSAMTVSGAYAIQGTTCPAMPFTLPAGSECTVSVSFVPTAEGASTGSLRVTSDAAPTLRDVSLSGSGEQPVETSSGGCTIGGDPSAPDPVLWLLLVVAAGVLLRRRLQKVGAP